MRLTLITFSGKRSNVGVKGLFDNPPAGRAITESLCCIEANIAAKASNALCIGAADYDVPAAW